MITFSKKYQHYFIIFGLFLLILLLFAFWPRNDGFLHLIFFDVGQGDGILIKAPTGELILIDGGPSEKIIYSLAKEVPFFERKIDLGIISHPHADHVTGFIEILRRYEVQRLIFDSHDHKTPEVEVLEKEIQNSGTPVDILSQGDEILIGNLRLEVLWPPIDYDCSNINDCSVVLRIDYGEFCAYLMADATNTVQKQLLNEYLKECPIIKIAHQGAKDGIDINFLKKNNPQIGIISVGKNNFGHPAETTLEILKNKDIKTLRTDKMGNIEIVTNGYNFKTITNGLDRQVNIK